MADWVPGVNIVSQYELSKAILGQKHKAGADWVRKTPDGRIEVDQSSPLFLAWIDKAVKNSKRRKSERAKKRALRDGFEQQGKSYGEPLSGPVDFRKLTEDSQRAELEKPIIDNMLQHYKIEKAKTQLEIETGNLVEWSLCEFLFVGYLDRANQEFLMFPKKQESKIEHILQDSIIRSPLLLSIENDELREQVQNVLAGIDIKSVARSIVRMDIREIEEIIRKVKKDQAEDVATYRKERGIN